MPFIKWKPPKFGYFLLVGVFTVYFIALQHWKDTKGMEKREKFVSIEETAQQSDVLHPIKRSNDLTKSLSFTDEMRTFPWSDFQESLHANDSAKMKRYSTLLLLKLVEFLKKPPLVSANTGCETPPQIPLTPPCRSVPRPRKVGILFQFGFDVDALEIHLHELNATVDYFFLIESIKPHSSFYASKKPLMWEMIKYDDRFNQFASKIVHFIVDDANLAKLATNNDIWAREYLQEELRWRKFLEWNNATNYFESDDLLGFGDVDEVPDRNNVAYLRNCQLPSDPVDIGIWFPFDGIDTVFKTDFPVNGHKFTLGDPSFWTVAAAMKHFENYGKAPTRMRGTSKSYLLGGMHLSRYAYPPFQMVKLLTRTESGLYTLKNIIEVGLLYDKNKSSDAETVLNTVPPHLLKKVQKLTEFSENNKIESDSIVKMPWFLNCNRQRYPAFDKKHDPRLDSV